MSIHKVRLVNASHRLPMPGSPGRFFRDTGESVNVEDPFWRALLADGSIELATDDPPVLTTADPPALEGRAGGQPPRGKPTAR